MTNPINNMYLTSIISGCVAEYFSSTEGITGSNKESDKQLLGYKCVLSSKATEETMVINLS